MKRKGKNFFDEFINPKDLLSFQLEKRQLEVEKRKAVAELASGEFESSVAESNQPESSVAGPSKSPRIQPENLDEVKTSLRSEIMSDLTEILAENQKEMQKLIALETSNSSDNRTLA